MIRLTLANAQDGGNQCPILNSPANPYTTRECVTSFALQFSDINGKYIFTGFTNVLRDKVFLRMDRKYLSIFTTIFNSYITGQENAKVIQRSGIIPITHQSRFFRKLQGTVAGKWSERGSKGPSQDARASHLYMTKKDWCLRHGL